MVVQQQAATTGAVAALARRAALVMVALTIATATGVATPLVLNMITQDRQKECDCFLFPLRASACATEPVHRRPVASRRPARAGPPELRMGKKKPGRRTQVTYAVHCLLAPQRLSAGVPLMDGASSTKAAAPNQKETAQSHQERRAPPLQRTAPRPQALANSPIP